MDLRERILRDCDAGVGTQAVARKYSVCEAFVRRLKQRRRETGNVAPRSYRPGPKPILDPYLSQLQELARAHPDLSAAELRDRLEVNVSPLTVWRALRRLGLTFKKNRFMPRNKSGPTFSKSGRSFGRKHKHSTRSG
jgi:transposase